MTDFTGQKAIVTGATRGIGRAITLSLLNRGVDVVGVYGGDEDAANRMREEASDLGGHFFLHCLDVSDYQEVKRFYTGIEEEFGTLDILVNNAGIRRDGVVAMMKEEDWHRVIDVNLSGCFNMSKFAVPLMLKKRYGRIIYITSPMGHLGFAGQANYSASKAGQIGLMKSLSKETAKRNITVNCVSPGFIDTDFLGDLPDDQKKLYAKMVPLKRFGTPEEVAESVLFLAGPGASYVTGSVLEVTGGL